MPAALLQRGGRFGDGDSQIVPYNKMADRSVSKGDDVIDSDYMKRMEKGFLSLGLPSRRAEILERYERRRSAAFSTFYRELMETWDNLKKWRDAELAALDDE